MDIQVHIGTIIRFFQSATPCGGSQNHSFGVRKKAMCGSGIPRVIVKTINPSTHVPRTCGLNSHDTMFRRGLSTVGGPCVDQKVCNQLPVFLFQIQKDIGRAAQCMQDQNELGIPQLSPNLAWKDPKRGFSFFRGIPQVVPKSYQKKYSNYPNWSKLIQNL